MSESPTTANGLQTNLEQQRLPAIPFCGNVTALYEILNATSRFGAKSVLMCGNYNTSVAGREIKRNDWRTARQRCSTRAVIEKQRPQGYM